MSLTRLGALWAICCLCASGALAQTRVQAPASGVVEGGNPNTITVAYGSNVAAGNVGLVIARAENGVATISSVADTRTTTYSALQAVTGAAPNLYLYAGTFGSSGANTVTVTWSATTNNYVWVQVIEVSGVTTVGAVTATTSAAGALDQICGALTTTKAAYWIMAASSGVATYTVGTDSLSNVWTLIDGSEGTGLDFGGVQEFSAGAALTSNTAHFVSGSNSASYTSVCAAFLSVSAPASLSLLGVGR